MDNKTSRRMFPRNLSMWLSALAAAPLAAQDSSKQLPSKAFPFESLPVKLNATNKSHAVLNGQTHSGFPVEVHVTELPAGQSPHPPHKHVHEEMFLIQSGVVEATVNGVKTRLTPGSVCYINSNDEHGVFNPGPERAEYFVVALGGDS